MLLEIEHRSTCRYPGPVSYSIQHLRLTPREDASQHAIEWRISTPGQVRHMRDAHGNLTHVLTLDRPHSEFEIVVRGTVDTAPPPGGRIPDQGGLSPMAYLADTPLTQHDERLRLLAGRHLGVARDLGGALLYFAAAIDTAIRHDPACRQPAGALAALEAGRGCCIDITHAFIAGCRAQGLPARFVSGYLVAESGLDATPHNWADVWVDGGEDGDGGAWVSVDVLERMPAGEGHCRLAVGRDYLDACPVRFVNREVATRSRVTAQLAGQQ